MVVLGFALVMLAAAIQVKLTQTVSVSTFPLTATHQPSLDTFRDVLVLSVSSFHGRGFSFNP